MCVARSPLSVVARYLFLAHLAELIVNTILSYRRETALHGALVLAKSGRLELGDNISRIIGLSSTTVT